jgi:hypothetical protein
MGSLLAVSFLLKGTLGVGGFYCKTAWAGCVGTLLQSASSSCLEIYRIQAWSYTELSFPHNAVRQETEAKEKEVQDKKAEIKLMQREKAELERIRHTDIVKLRLEVRLSMHVTYYVVVMTILQCDAKMLKLQKQQNFHAQQAVAQPSSSNDIFRKVCGHNPVPVCCS